MMDEPRLNGGAVAWARTHPDDDTFYQCCTGEAIGGALACACWRPVFDTGQAPPEPVTDVSTLQIADGMCGDCAYRPGSPERAQQWSAEALLALPADGELFFCHAGMRRPVRWEHPDGRTVPASPHDYQPPIVGGIPYRADGQPALLCAGWALAAYRWHRG